jgi:hypothetical protein
VDGWSVSYRWRCWRSPADHSSGRSAAQGTGAAAGAAAAPPTTNMPANTVNATELAAQALRPDLDTTTVNPFRSFAVN